MKLMKNIVIIISLLIANVAIAEPRDVVADTQPLYTNNYGYSVRNAVINSQSDTYINPKNHIKVTVFGKDERENLYADEEKYFNFIQLVENEFGFHGTGFVTGGNCDVLVTNAHNLYDADKYRKYIRDEVKSPGKSLKNLNYLPSPNGNKTIKAVLISRGSYEGDLKASYNDWAILRLNRPAYKNCNRKVEFDYEGDACNDAFLVGYHVDSVDRKLVSFCKFRSYSDSMVMHYCDSKTGSSGAPLFCREDNTNKIVALNDGATLPIGYKGPEKKGVSSSLKYSNKHYNHAIKFRGDFLSALKKELGLSEKRAK